jgi:hypothetical protein
MFQTKVLEKIKTHILYPITFFQKSCRFWDNVKNCGTARQATGDYIIRSMMMPSLLHDVSQLAKVRSAGVHFSRNTTHHGAGVSHLVSYLNSVLVSLSLLSARWKQHTYFYMFFYVLMSHVWVCKTDNWQFRKKAAHLPLIGWNLCVMQAACRRVFEVSSRPQSAAMA